MNLSTHAHLRETRRAAHHVRLVAGFLLAMAALGLAGCRQQAVNAPPPPTVTVTRPLAREVTKWDEYTGHLASPFSANVVAQVSGIIVSTPFKEGALVKKGDVLFVIDDRPFQADLDQKRASVSKDVAQVEFTQAQLSRSEDLLKKKTVSQQDYDSSKASFESAKAQTAADEAAVRTAEINLDWTRVKAPIDGRVSRIFVTEGNMVNASAATNLTTIFSVDPMYCIVSVPERAYLQYQAYARGTKRASLRDGTIPCYIQLENETDFPHEGNIDFIDNRLDPATGTIELRASIANHNGELSPGLFAEMRLTGTGAYKTLLVPDQAVSAEQNERYLYVVGKDNVVDSRKVKLGELFGSLRSITDGLQADERVIVNGLQLAQPGVTVNPKEVPVPAEAIAELEASTSGLAATKKNSEPAAPPAPVEAKP
jgi:RND family efflux transporter MFP subunit